MPEAIIELNNISIIINKDIDESIELFYARSWYISKLQPKNNTEFKDAVVKSKIWANITYLENSYPEEIQKLI